MPTARAATATESAANTTVDRSGPDVEWVPTWSAGGVGLGEAEGGAGGVSPEFGGVGEAVGDAGFAVGLDVDASGSEGVAVGVGVGGVGVVISGIGGVAGFGLVSREQS